MKKGLAGLLCAALLFGLTACGGDSEPKEKVYIEEDKIADMYTSPDDYKGKYVKLTGRVFTNPEAKDKQIAFQMWQDPKNSANNTVITCDKSADLAQNDYIRIEGYVDGTFEGKNMMGGTVKAPKIVAESVEKISYQDAASPTLKAVDSNVVKEANNVTYTIQKVEFAKDETRVYLSLDNKSPDKYSFYSFNVKIVQNGKQYEEKYNYEANYKELTSELLPGIKDEGIIAFPAMDQANFQLITEGSSSNYNVDRDYLTFDIEVK